ncbi:MAG: hypothetical protein M3Q07_01885 [Pseudobdellovibrionaceae bacterium]|nr:hypothetical protein [Pseudobdellovibrionaceae bacterium]
MKLLKAARRPLMHRILTLDGSGIRSISMWTCRMKQGIDNAQGRDAMVAAADAVDLGPLTDWMQGFWIASST